MLSMKEAKEQRTSAMVDIMLHMRHLEDECQRVINHSENVEILLREKKKLLKINTKWHPKCTNTNNRKIAQRSFS